MLAWKLRALADELDLDEVAIGNDRLLEVDGHRGGAADHDRIRGLADDVGHGLDIAGRTGSDGHQLGDVLAVIFNELPTIRARHRVRHDDRRLAKGTHDLAEALDHHVTGETIDGNVTAAADAGPIRHHHLVARAHEGLRPT